LVCPKPLDQRGLHFLVPDCPLALGIEVGLIVRLGENFSRSFQCGRDGSLANFDTMVVFEPFFQVFLWKLRIVSFVLAKSYVDLVRHNGMKSSFLQHCFAPTFGERVWRRLTSWLPTTLFIERRRVSESTQSPAFHNFTFCQDFYHSCHMIFYMLLWSSTKLHKVPLPSPMIHDLLLTSMTFHAALAGFGMIFV
jgi:hypothetical protein